MTTKSLFQMLIVLLVSLTAPLVVLAQEPELEPCDNVVVDSYDLSDMTLSASCSVFTPTIANPDNMTLPYPSYATISNINNCVNGPSESGVPVELFFEDTIYGSITKSIVITSSFGAQNNGGTLNGFIVISSTGYYTPSTPGISVDYDAPLVLSDLWQIGPDTSGEYDGSLIRQTITFTGITGDVIGVRLVSGNNDILDNTSVNIGRWEAAGLCEKEPGGGDTCTTVTDAHFTGTPSFEDGGWKLSNATTIHDSYIDITADDFFKNTFEVFTPTQKMYTATVYARSATTQTSSIAVGISEKTLNGEYVSFDVDETVDDEFGIYTFVLSNSVPAGELGYIFIQAGEPGLQIDYICLEPSNGICADPDKIDYVYVGEDNQWDNGLHEWTPTEIDADLSLPKLERFYDDWRNPLHITGAYVQDVRNGYFNFWDIIGRIVSVFKFDTDEMESIYRDDAVLSSIALKMPGEGMLESISVDIGHLYSVYGNDLRVFAKVDGEWVEVGSSTTTYDETEGSLDHVDTITIPLQPVNQHTEYMLLSTVSFPDFNIWGFFAKFYITKISTYGCGAGDAYTGQCVVSDESLDEGADGGPDPYYWQLFNGALSIPGGAVLAAENMSYIAQNVYTPNPGAYQLTIGLINNTSDRCELYARGTRESEYTEDDFFNVLLPCVNSTAVQTVTADVSLPDDQFRFILSANRGHATVTDICFHLPKVQSCLNQNPEFTNGTTGYDGNFSFENGRVILNPATQIHAYPPAQTPFYSGKGPWMLQVTAASAISGDVVLSAITPGLNPVDTTIAANQYHQISDTQVLTYAISLTDEDQQAMTLTGNGPSVYNNDADGRLYVSKYCLMTDTGTVWWGAKDCTQVTNPDFLLGLTGWTSVNAIGVGGWAVLDSGGYVKQRVMMDNLVSNGHFDTGYSGWSSIWGDTLSSATGYSGNGLQIVAAGASGLGAKYQVSVSPNTAYTLFGRVKASVAITPTLYFGIYTTGYGTIARATVTKNGEFDEYVVTGNSGANSSILALVFASSATAGTVVLDDVALVQGDTIPVQYVEPADATVHWIAKSGIASEITATVSVSSSNGVFSTTQVVGPAIEEFFTPFEIGGDVDLTVATAATGLELDFVCLNSGTYTSGPGGEGGTGEPPWTPGVGDGRCAPPPMVILTNTLTAWMPSIWIWSNAPSNYEVVSVYSAAWLRYIGCTLTDLQKMLEVKLDTIIAKLGTSTGGGWADALARIFEAIARIIEAIAGIISQLLTLLISIWNALAPGLGLIWQLVATLLELLDMIIRLLAEFAGWLLQMMMTFVQIVFGLMMDSATIPGEMLTAYNSAVNDPAYDIIPLSSAPVTENGVQTQEIALDCSNPDSNYWCGILFGFQVVNQTLGASILYPIVIVGLILSTIFVFKNQLWEYYNVKIK